LNSGDVTLPIESSRGCPYNCTFCSADLCWGKRVRYKSVNNFVQEICDTKKKYPNVKLSIIDD